MQKSPYKFSTKNEKNRNNRMPVLFVLPVLSYSLQKSKYYHKKCELAASSTPTLFAKTPLGKFSPATGVVRTPPTIRSVTLPSVGVSPIPLAQPPPYMISSNFEVWRSWGVPIQKGETHLWFFPPKNSTFRGYHSPKIDLTM